MPLTLVPDRAAVRVQHRGHVDVLLLQRRGRECGSDLEEDGEGGDKEEEALGERRLRTHGEDRREGFVRGGREMRWVVNRSE